MALVIRIYEMYDLDLIQSKSEIKEVLTVNTSFVT